MSPRRDGSRTAITGQGTWIVNVDETGAFALR